MELPEAWQQEGFLKTSVLADALRALNNQNKRRIPLSAFDPILARDFEKLDVNNNGYMDFSEIEEAVRKLILNKRKVHNLVLLICILASFMILFLGAMVGLVYLVVNIQKVCELVDHFLSISRMEINSSPISGCFRIERLSRWQS